MSQHAFLPMMDTRPSGPYYTPDGPRRYGDNVIPLVRAASRRNHQIALSGGDPAPPGVRLHLLGGFGLYADGQRLAVGASVQRLLALLALRRHPVQRATIACQLWEDTTDRRAQANLRTALYRLNQVCDRVVEVTAKTLRIDPEVRVDVWEVSEFAGQVLDGRPVAPGSAPTIDTLNRDLLPDWDDQWLRPEQQRFRNLRLHCLEALCDRLVSDGRFGQAADAALSVVNADPFRESAHNKLIKVYLAEGNRNEAVQHYLRFRRTLRDELGLNPSAEMGQLIGTAQLEAA